MASNQCFMRIEKIKTLGALTARYNHDYRIAEVDNADPERSGQNEILFALRKDEDGNTMSYYEAWHQRIHEAQVAGRWDHIRSNGVLAYDIILSYSADFGIDEEEWKRRNVHWLQTTFNQTHDDKNNLLSCVLHRDESNIHCHAIVVPIAPDNRLNASYFTDGAVKMRKLQDSYAKEMKDLGLKRGVPRSSAKHQDIRHMYAELKQDITLPKPKKGELAKDYIDRVENELKNRAGNKIKKAKEKAQKLLRKADELIQMERDELEREYAMHLAEGRSEKEDLESDIRITRRKKDKLEGEVQEASQILENMMQKLKEQEAILNEMQEYKRFKNGLERLTGENPAKAEATREMYSLCIDLSDEPVDGLEKEFPEIYGPS